MNIDVLLPSIPLVLLRAWILSTNKKKTLQTVLPSHAPRNHKLFYIRSRREGNAVCVTCTQMQHWKSERERWIGMRHYVITEWWSQRGIKMFQTNITLLYWSNALCHCLWVFACAFEQNEEERLGGGNTKCTSVFWVCLLCEWLVSESVVPVCHGLMGLWVC